MLKLREVEDRKVRSGSRSGVLRACALVLSLLAGPSWAAESPVQQQMRQVEGALSRISQEQQAIFQQFQMVQEMRRNEERQMLPLQPYASTAPRNYEDVQREQEARALRIKQTQYELDRLYARYRELEDQKTPLLETLSALAQRPPEAAAVAGKPPAGAPGAAPIAPPAAPAAAPSAAPRAPAVVR
jgi:hypothetical protein